MNKRCNEEIEMYRVGGEGASIGNLAAIRNIITDLDAKPINSL